MILLSRLGKSINLGGPGSGRHKTLSSLTDEERSSVDRYVSGYGVRQSDETDFANALDKAPVFSGQAYRALMLNGLDRLAYVPGKTIGVYLPTSFTKDKNLVGVYSPKYSDDKTSKMTVISANLKSGADIEEANPEQKEVIAKGGTHFRVDHADFFSTPHRIHLTEVDSPKINMNDVRFSR